MLNQKLQTYLMQDPVIQQAYKNLEIARMNNAERYELEGRETWLRDQLGAMEYALTEGFTNGLTKGLSEGRTEGRSEGVAQITLRQLTRRLGELPTPVQTQISALKLPQLEQLADALLDFVSLTDLQVWLDHANEKDPAQNFTGL